MRAAAQLVLNDDNLNEIWNKYSADQNNNLCKAEVEMMVKDMLEAVLKIQIRKLSDNSGLKPLLKNYRVRIEKANAEYKVHAERLVSELDENGDGLVQKDEFMAYVKELQTQRKEGILGVIAAGDEGSLIRGHSEYVKKKKTEAKLLGTDSRRETRGSADIKDAEAAVAEARVADSKAADAKAVGKGKTNSTDGSKKYTYDDLSQLTMKQLNAVGRKFGLDLPKFGDMDALIKEVLRAQGDNISYFGQAVVRRESITAIKPEIKSSRKTEAKTSAKKTYEDLAELTMEELRAEGKQYGLRLPKFGNMDTMIKEVLRAQGTNVSYFAQSSRIETKDSAAKPEAKEEVKDAAKPKLTYEDLAEMTMQEVRAEGKKLGLDLPKFGNMDAMIKQVLRAQGDNVSNFA